MVLSDVEFDDDTKERAKSLVTCSICLEQFAYPKVLPCLHTFCLCCLKKCFESTNQQRLMHLSNFPCPSCRKLCYVPPGGLEHLPSDFRAGQVLDFVFSVKNSIKRNSKDANIPDLCSICVLQEKACPAKSFCIKCNKAFCDQCLDDHSKTKIFRNHTVISDSLKRNIESAKNVEKCTAHGAGLEYFCKECSELLCIVCLFSEHDGHEVVERGEMVVGIDEELMEIEEHIRRKLDSFDEMMKSVDNCMQYLELKMDKYQSSIESVERKIDILKEELRRDYLTIGNEILADSMETINKRREHIKQLVDVFRHNYNLAVEARKLKGSHVFFMNYKSIKAVDEVYSDVRVEPLTYKICEFLPLPEVSYGTSNAVRQTVSFPSLMDVEGMPASGRSTLVVSDYVRMTRHCDSLPVRETSLCGWMLPVVLVLMISGILCLLLLLVLSTDAEGFEDLLNSSLRSTVKELYSLKALMEKYLSLLHDAVAPHTSFISSDIFCLSFSLIISTLLGMCLHKFGMAENLVFILLAVAAMLFICDVGPLGWIDPSKIFGAY